MLQTFHTPCLRPVPQVGADPAPPDPGRHLPLFLHRPKTSPFFAAPPFSAPYRRSALILYRQILDGIEKNGFNNFTQRAYVPKLRKFARCAACAALHCAAPGLHVCVVCACVLAWVRGVAGWPSWSGGRWALSVVFLWKLALDHSAPVAAACWGGVVVHGAVVHGVIAHFVQGIG